ncbi:hypothetical protein [Skermanella stibiiresistens]|nr:hypothetical protein [Skermanella stibiiresistens]
MGFEACLRPPRRLDWFHTAMRRTGRYAKGSAHHGPVEAMVVR